MRPPSSSTPGRGDLRLVERAMPREVEYVLYEKEMLRGPTKQLTDRADADMTIFIYR